VQYEFQLTNVGRVSIDVPVSPELDKIFVACRSGREQQAGLVLSYHKSAGASMEILPGTSDWSGCQGAKNSMVALSPGQWISYRGSALLPLDVDLSGTIGGAWLLSDISYRTAPGGLIENSACTLSVNSSHKQLE
jgi:hypothetical protein